MIAKDPQVEDVIPFLFLLKKMKRKTKGPQGNSYPSPNKEAGK